MFIGPQREAGSDICPQSQHSDPLNARPGHPVVVRDVVRGGQGSVRDVVRASESISTNK